MTLQRSLTVAALLLLAPAAAPAAEYGPQIDQFFATLKGGKSTEALDALYRSNPWISRSGDQVQNVKTQMAGLGNVIGALKSWEKLRELKVGSRFVYVSYLVLYERQPLRFEFEFFKPADDWTILGFSFDDKMDDDVEKTAHEALGRK